MKNKYILLIATSLVLVVLVSVGISYALWNQNIAAENVNTANTGCFDISLSDEKNNINLANAYPISTEKGKSLVPYSFTVTNICSIFASYSINLEILNGSTLDSNFVDVLLNSESIQKLSDYESTITKNSDSVESRTLFKGNLSSGDSEDFSLRLWIDEDTTMEDLNNEAKTFISKIIVSASPSTYTPVNAGYTKLYDAIFANEYQTTPSLAKQKIESKEAPDFTQTAPTIIWQDAEPLNELVSDYWRKVTDINIDEATSDLTENDTMLELYKTYSLNESTGNYTLSDPIYYGEDSNFDFDNNDYYFISDSVMVNDSTKKIFSSRVRGGSGGIYKVKSITTTREKITLNGKEYNCIKYVLQFYRKQSVLLESDKSDKGLYPDVDDYGTTYYYRGSVKNNYVYFANNYWQIVRINGDGSIRLIYAGTKNSNNEFTTTYKTVIFSNDGRDNPAYLGYMYGKDLSSRENAVKNEVDSNAKIVVDSWYEENIIKNNLESFISDNGFCNDRSLYSGDGYSTNDITRFGGWERITKNTPQFKCPDVSNDLFTTSSSSIGNKALKYPVGLITYDELAFSGFNNVNNNTLSFLYYKSNYYTMTPSYYIDQDDGIIIFYYPGRAVSSSLRFASGIRPVISLKVDVEITGGIGTANDPFVINYNK